MAASEKFVLNALRLVLVLGAAPLDPATAQEAAPQAAGAVRRLHRW